MIDILLKRRSTRDFTSKVVEPEKIEKLVQAALLSPTAKNLHSCEIIVIENKKVASTYLKQFNLLWGIAK